MSNYFLVKWVEPVQNKNSRYSICIRRSIVASVNPRMPVDKITRGDQLRIKKRGSKVERLATMYLHSDEIHPLLSVRPLIKNLEANLDHVTDDSACFLERYVRITTLLENLWMQLEASNEKPVNIGTGSLDTNNNKAQTTSRRDQSADNVTEADNNSRNNDSADEYVRIGSGSTEVKKKDYNKVNWRTYTVATRTLLSAVFERRTLATHSLTGKKSPAFQNKPAKLCLDPQKISDIIYEIMKRFKIKRNLIRNIITIKCADECKMKRTRDNFKKKAKR